MPFTKLCLQSSVFVVCILVLVGCGQIATKDSSVNENADASVDSNAPADNGKGFVSITAIAQPENLEKVSVPSAAKQEFASALQAMQAQQWEKAEGLLLLMSETYPQLSGVYTNLGIVYQNMDKLDKAEKSYRFALSANRYNFDAYTNLGKVYRELGQFSEAEENYKQALALWPHHKPSLINLGVLYDLYLGQLDLALKNFKLAQQLNTKEDRTLKGWIIDLERRITAQAG